jgi:hypothetical protein
LVIVYFPLSLPLSHTSRQFRIEKLFFSPDDDFKGEPGVAHALDEEEGLVGVGLGLVQGPGVDLINQFRAEFTDR